MANTSGINEKEKNLVVLLKLFAVFFKIGSLTVGGGYVMLPLIENELVEKKKWFKKESFVDVLALSQTVPGALAVNTAFQAGYRLYGLKGGFIAIAGAILPSFLIILAVVAFLTGYRDYPGVTTFFDGALPAVAALVAAAAWKLGKNVIREAKGLVLFMVLLLAGYFWSLHPFAIIGLGALLGLFLFREQPRDEGENREVEKGP